jgi:hypothetical protein
MEKHKASERYFIWGDRKIRVFWGGFYVWLARFSDGSRMKIKMVKR